MTYREILAKKAFKVTVSHENRARAMMANKWPFFSEVGGVGRYLREKSCATVFFFSFDTVHSAVSRAKVAFLQ
jgi:hypothetical protein